MSQRTLGFVIAVVGSIVALLAFFAMPYFSLGLLSLTGSQLASSNGFIQGYPVLWVEPIIAVIALLIAALQLFNAQRSSDERAGKGVATLLSVLASLTLLVLLGKYFLFDTHSTTSTNSLGYTSTGPAIASFYSSGFWVYIIGMVAILVGGIVVTRSPQQDIAIPSEEKRPL